MYSHRDRSQECYSKRKQISSEFLIEFETKEEAEKYLASGVDFHEIHLNCDSPHCYHINVSILGLRAYMDDDKVIEVLSEFGEIKSDVLCLKYKAGHDLTSLENGNGSCSHGPFKGLNSIFAQN